MALTLGRNDLLQVVLSRSILGPEGATENSQGRKPLG